MAAVLWPNGSASIPRVSSEFNLARRNPVTGVVQPHWGIDLIGWSTIVAPATGSVTFAGYNGGAGNEVRIRADGPNAFIKGDVYRLLHNRELWVRTGQRVNQGQGVAVMGTTGQSTGVHCHYETRPGGGAAINPRDYHARVNGGSPAGGGDDMGAAEMAKLENIEALLAGTGPSLKDPNWHAGQGSVLQHLQNLTGFIWAGGTSAADPNYLGAPGTLYNLAKAPVLRTAPDGKTTLKVPQIQDNADTNTMVRQLLSVVQTLASRPVVEFTDEQIDVLSDGLADALVEKGVGGASKAEVQAVVTEALSALVLRSVTPQ